MSMYVTNPYEFIHDTLRESLSWIDCIFICIYMKGPIYKYIQDLYRCLILYILYNIYIIHNIAEYNIKEYE